MIRLGLTRYLLLALGCMPMVVASWSPAHADTRQSSCPGFGEGQTKPEHVDQFYANRAVSIVSAGLKGDIDALAALVAPNATFGFSDADSLFASRQPGVAGALQLVAALKPVRFQHATPRSFVTVTSLKCERTTTILFRREQPDEGVAMTFDFVDGLLVKATGKVVWLSEGEVR